MTTTKYRLTDKGRKGLSALLDADTLDETANGIPGAGYLLNLPDGWTEPASPPLPPEPPYGSVVAVHTENAEYPRVFKRWGDTYSGDELTSRWFEAAAGMGWRTWAGVCDIGTPALLVPAPEPVTLPWSAAYRSDREEVRLTVERDGARVCVRLSVAGQFDDDDEELASFWTPPKARAVADALLSAADEAERDRG